MPATTGVLVVTVDTAGCLAGRLVGEHTGVPVLNGGAGAADWSVLGARSVPHTAPGYHEQQPGVPW